MEERLHITYLNDLKHRNDVSLNNGFDYQTNLFRKLLSNVMFGNENLKNFLVYLQQNVVWMIDSVLPIRNWFNYTVDKYYSDFNN